MYLRVLTLLSPAGERAESPQVRRWGGTRLLGKDYAALRSGVLLFTEDIKSLNRKILQATKRVAKGVKGPKGKTRKRGDKEIFFVVETLGDHEKEAAIREHLKSREEAKRDV